MKSTIGGALLMSSLAEVSGGIATADGTGPISLKPLVNAALMEVVVAGKQSKCLSGLESIETDDAAIGSSVLSLLWSLSEPSLILETRQLGNLGLG